VDTIFTSVGASSNMFFDSSIQEDKASIYVKLVPVGDRDRDVDQVAEDIRQRVQKIAGGKIKVSVMDMSSEMGNSAALSRCRFGVTT
jgi:HAE1 family hydrophobic/amphiphilic exporter-1